MSIDLINLLLYQHATAKTKNTKTGNYKQDEVNRRNLKYPF